jgi:hypothetical protein
MRGDRSPLPFALCGQATRHAPARMHGECPRACLIASWQRPDSGLTLEPERS